MEWMTTKEASEAWGVSTRQVQTLCERGQVKGAKRLGHIWVIPYGTSKPIDGRYKNGRISVKQKK